MEILQAALPLLFAVGWGVLQLISAVQGNDKKPKPARRPRPAGEAAGEAAAGDANADLRSEVDEFLRRLKDPDAEPPRPEPARQSQERQKRPRRPRVEVLVDDGPPSEPPPRRLVPAAEQAQPATSRPKAKQRRSKPSPADQAERLRERVARADTSIHEKFDHEVGNLAAQASDAAEHAYDEPAYETAPGAAGDQPAKPSPAESIAAMLRDPDNVRNAVILNEILTRRG